MVKCAFNISPKILKLFRKPFRALEIFGNF